MKELSERVVSRGVKELFFVDERSTNTTATAGACGFPWVSWGVMG
jgi:hypothetical protein